MSDVNAAELRAALAEAAPDLVGEIQALVHTWTRPILAELERRAGRPTFPKAFNDPVWGTIELLPWEVLILDSPLMQRLRGVRQLGMAHQVYPGAVHDRLDHARGVVEAAQRILSSLERNADHRRNFGTGPDRDVPPPSELDRVSSRLGALLHDVGHGPFSHATEDLVRARLLPQFRSAETVLRASFEGVTSIATSETVAVLIVMSTAMDEVFQHSRFGACRDHADLAAAVAARIIGSRSCLKATYLSGVVSGPLDADKIDYMARDSHHAGLPLGLDITRLIAKLEVVTVTPENAPNADLRKRAESAEGRRFYEVGISLSGLGAYEQMIIGRVILYDRLYYHHKVRAAEAMVRSLISVAEEECGEQYTLSQFYGGLGDDTLIGVLGGLLTSSSVPSGRARSATLSAEIQERRLAHRAFAFASRFIAGLDGLPPQERDNTRALKWRDVLRTLSDTDKCTEIARSIHAKAKELGEAIPALGPTTSLLVENVLVDLPSNKVVARGGEILTRTDNDHVGTPNLFFDPDRWSEAYTHQKQAGYVFTKREHVPAVALASRIVFYDRFQLAMGIEADRVAKTRTDSWAPHVDTAAKKNLCSAECAEMLTDQRIQLALIREEDVRLPDDVTTAEPGLKKRLAAELRAVLSSGLPASLHEAVLATIEHLMTFALVAEQTGTFVGKDINERDLQKELLKHVRARGGAAQEGTEVGGGESDVILGKVVVENKVRGVTANPLEVGEKYTYQARRYRIAVCSTVSCVIVGYKPSDENAILPIAARIMVRSAGDPSASAEIRLVVPYGHVVPHDAKAPRGLA